MRGKCRDSKSGIATRYEPDGPVRMTFFVPIHNDPGDYPAPCKMCAASLCPGKEAVEWC